MSTLIAHYSGMVFVFEKMIACRKVMPSAEFICIIERQLRQGASAQGGR